jgi:hypothetical protein
MPKTAIGQVPHPAFQTPTRSTRDSLAESSHYLKSTKPGDKIVEQIKVRHSFRNPDNGRSVTMCPSTTTRSTANQFNLKANSTQKWALLNHASHFSKGGGSPFLPH